MRILITAPIKEPINKTNCRGSVAACIRLANGLAEKGHKIYLAGHFGFDSNNVISNKITKINMFTGKSKIRYVDVFKLLRTHYNKVDIINTHYDTYSVMKYLSEITEIPIVHTLHTWVESTDVAYYSKNDIIKAIENPNIYFTFVSDSQYSTLFKVLKIPQVSDGNVKISHGISNLEHVKFDIGMVPPEYRNGYFLSVARIRKSKNIDIIIKAAVKAKMPLIVLGKKDPTFRKSDTYSEEVENLIRINNIFCIPELSHEKTLQLIKGAKAVVLNSTFDTFSLVLLEAARLGIPGIVNCHGGTEEIRNLLKGRGLVEYNGTEKELSDIIKTFNGTFDNSNFPKELEWDYMIDKYERFFNSIINGDGIDYYKFK